MKTRYQSLLTTDHGHHQPSPPTSPRRRQLATVPRVVKPRIQPFRQPISSRSTYLVLRLPQPAVTRAAPRRVDAAIVRRQRLHGEDGYVERARREWASDGPDAGVEVQDGLGEVVVVLRLAGLRVGVELVPVKLDRVSAGEKGQFRAVDGDGVLAASIPAGPPVRAAVLVLEGVAGPVAPVSAVLLLAVAFKVPSLDDVVIALGQRRVCDEARERAARRLLPVTRAYARKLPEPVVEEVDDAIHLLLLVFGRLGDRILGTVLHPTASR